MITEILVSVPAICMVLVAILVMGVYVSDHESQLNKLQEKLRKLDNELEQVNEELAQRDLLQQLKSIKESEA